MALVSISICLSDIPKEMIKTASNGKKYIKIHIAEMKQPDNYNNTHTAYILTEDKQKTYLGKGKMYEFTDDHKMEQIFPAGQSDAILNEISQRNQQQQQASASSEPEEDLPF